MEEIIYEEINFIFTNEIKSFDNGKDPVLKEGCEWKKIEIIKNPKYISRITQHDAGPINTEMVSAVTEYDPNSILRKHLGFHVILQLKSEIDIFFVGSLQNPANYQIQPSSEEDTYIFIAKSSA